MIKAPDKNRTELYLEIEKWQRILLAIYDKQDEIDVLRNTLAVHEKHLTDLTSQLPQSIINEYEQLKVVWKLKGEQE